MTTTATLTLTIAYDTPPGLDPAAAKAFEATIRELLTPIGHSLAGDGRMTGYTELEVESWAAHLDITHDPSWARGDYLATFTPQQWQRGYAVEVDPQGQTTWPVAADELVSGLEWHDRKAHDYYDYLKTSRFAPQWVKDHDGPFEIQLKQAPKHLRTTQPNTENEHVAEKN